MTDRAEWASENYVVKKKKNLTCVNRKVTRMTWQKSFELLLFVPCMTNILDFKERKTNLLEQTGNSQCGKYIQELVLGA